MNDLHTSLDLLRRIHISSGSCLSFVTPEHSCSPPQNGTTRNPLPATQDLVDLVTTRSPRPATQGLIDLVTTRNPLPATEGLVDLATALLPETYTISESDFCSRHPDLQIIAYVHSSVSETEKRRITRETWARASEFDSGVKVGVVFMVGSAKTPREAAIVREESQAHRDIVQGEYDDSYHTLSYKALASLRWVSIYCPRVPWTLHADDDVLLDLFLLTRFLKEVHKEDSFFCFNWKGSEVKRFGKWQVSRTEFLEKNYPPYCSGAVWILATHLVYRLLNATRQEPFLWVDDVYITGILAKRAGIGHFGHLKEFLRIEKITPSDLGKFVAWVHIPDRGRWWRTMLSYYGYMKMSTTNVIRRLSAKVPA
ncbi:beta-1,3-galactosyltransferase 5-like [Macrobrachium rosenbergii]|uniref:beta-1,3-galactosyltransferase 5-like n=1 Tax=Macrobrachium rosenbergii TaxID=79674 RepID=UPI0034D6009F